MLRYLITINGMILRPTPCLKCDRCRAESTLFFDATSMPSHALADSVRRALGRAMCGWYSLQVWMSIPCTGAMTTEDKVKTVVAQIQQSRLAYVRLAMETYETEILLWSAFRQGVAGSGLHVWTFRDLPRTPGGVIMRSEFAPKHLLLLS